MASSSGRSILFVCLLLAAGCRVGEPGPPAPLYRLADQEAERAGMREPAALTLGDDTRYVFAPVSGSIAVEENVWADDAGLVRASLRCPVELHGEIAIWTAETVAVQARAHPIAQGTTGIVQCAVDDAPYDVTLDTGAPGAPTLVRTVVSAPPSAHVSVPLGPLPPDAWLRFATGVHRLGTPPADATVPVEVRAEGANGASITLWKDRLPVPAPDQPEAWQEVEVPLDRARGLGEPLRLVFAGEPIRQGENAAFVGWGDVTVWAARAPAAEPAWNVLVVSLDTLRADRLGTYGYPLDTSPVLDRLAREGTVFERAISQSNWTLPSHATMLTGTYPCVHDKGRGLRPKSADTPQAEALPGGISPLAEILRRAGYSTVAFTENGYLTPGVFQRGFDLFRADRRESYVPTAGLVAATVGAAVRWLEGHASERFFLFVHTYQVHQPYEPPPSYADRIPHGRLPLPPGGLAPSTKASVDAARYVAEVAYTDASLAPLLDALDALQLRDRTIVLVTSDHGEAFGEHRATVHGTSLYEEELWVPMLWRAPGLVAAGQRVSGMVGLVDVTPTILGLLGIERPPWMQGTDLVPWLGPEPPRSPLPNRVLPIESLAQNGMRTDAWKAIGTAKGFRTYDLGRDPGERRPGQGNDAMATARKHLDDECARGRAAVATAPDADRRPTSLATPDPARDQKLRALGYVE